MAVRLQGMGNEWKSLWWIWQRNWHHSNSDRRAFAARWSNFGEVLNSRFPWLQQRAQQMYQQFFLQFQKFCVIFWCWTFGCWIETGLWNFFWRFSGPKSGWHRLFLNSSENLAFWRLDLELPGQCEEARTKAGKSLRKAVWASTSFARHETCTCLVQPYILIHRYICIL